MNETLTKLKVIVSQAASDQDSAKQQRLSELQRLSNAAAPLLVAYSDLRDQFVSLSVLQQVWPSDYHARRDTVNALFLGYIGEFGIHYGLRFLVPGGQMRFSVEPRANGQLVYVTTWDVCNSRPTSKEYLNCEDWLNHFLRAMSDLIEIPK